ncbi:MAG TPA: protein-tyrosine phosphatase family protein [Rhizomicrobium sp.]|jgi:protein-tyrosine phosphatase|nr:protein-tyrosine phosphatase family protein [Rhizomicrobium sp.]
MAVADLYWIDLEFPGRLAVAPKPRGGDWLEDEIRSWRAQAIDCVVCLLENDEIAELSLGAEAKYCAENEVAFLRFPIADRGLPDSHREAIALVRDIANRLQTGQNVLIHCRAGIGRTGLVAAGTLISLGVAPEHALAAIGTARRVQVPDTDAQRDWIFAFAQNWDAAH